MASPFVRVDNGNIIGDSSGKLTAEIAGYLGNLRNGTIASSASPIASHSQAGASGSLSGTEGGDVLAVNLTEGVTYTFAYRGTPTDGIEDPYLAIFNGAGTVVLAEDDDGGAGRTSMITFTPTATGSYLLYATSWYTLAFNDPTLDTGNYTINMWTANPAHDAPATTGGAVAIGEGTTFAHLDVAGDVDVYSVNITAGQYYTFNYAGGVSGAEDWDGAPGENIGVLQLLDAAGNVIATDINYDSSLGYFAEQDGTIYVRVSAYVPPNEGNSPAPAPMTGGYTLDVDEFAPTDRDPLDAINWVDAANVPFVEVDGVPTAYVYFADAGENFGETNDQGGPMRTWGWNEYEIQQVMSALDQYEHILGVNYVITDDPEQATFRLLTTRSDLYGAYAYPQDPDYGDQAGIVVFNTESGGWDFDQQQSLEQGGFAYAVILHEFGHAHGLAHPHDEGGSSEVLLGTTGPDSLGIYDLNQGVYTVMSYNDAWETHPDGPTPYTGAGIDSGWSGTLSAFDIAALQQRYGVHAYNTGNNTYALTDVQDDAFYQTIWDTGGTDSIAYDGASDARIDLLAATLDYTPTGGGVVSFVDGIWGGYTIANGVVIENASGGSGDDVLLGNNAANVLAGNGGDDLLMGRGGNDTLNGGAGSDTASYANASGGVTVNLKSGSVRGADGSDSLISIENVVGSAFADSITGSDAANRLDGGAGNDTLSGGKGSDVYVFSDAGTDTISGYERGEDIDLSGLDVTRDDVTILSDRIVVDLAGDQDLTILFNTRNFSDSDLVFADVEASAAMNSAAQFQSDYFL